MKQHRDAGGWLARAGQYVGIAFIAGIAALILHKSVADISRLANLHSGEAFWRALARYFMANLGA
ncbi:hypothetical protein D3C83_159920 [compost metagenome]